MRRLILFLLAALPVFGQGTALTTNTWVKQSPLGAPASMQEFNKSTYIGSRKLSCAWASYHHTINDENSSSLVCYSYRENRWVILENGGMWHTENQGQGGHTTGVIAWDSTRDVLVSMTDWSASNSDGEVYMYRWWWFDPTGLIGRDKGFDSMPFSAAAGSPQSPMVYDAFNDRMIGYPSAWAGNTGKIVVCNTGATPNSCTSPATTGTAPPGNLITHGAAYNSSDHKTYWFGGQSGSVQNDIYTFDAATNIWAQLTTTCVGADCSGGKPPGHQRMGFAYSTQDNIFLMAGGLLAGNVAASDTWTFDPAGLVWTELSPSGSYGNSAGNTWYDRMTYDQDSNAFVVMNFGVGSYGEGSGVGQSVSIYVFAYSTPLNYGRVTNTYTPPATSINRTDPTTTDASLCSSLGNVCQSWGYRPSLAVSGTTVYEGHSESGSQFDWTLCGAQHHPTAQSTPNNSVWTKLGASLCSIDDGGTNTVDGSSTFLTVASGTLWMLDERWSTGAVGPSHTFGSSWNGSSWTSAAIGCIFHACGSGYTQRPVGLVTSSGNPVVLVTENNSGAASPPETYLYAIQNSGGSWAQLGSGVLNINGAGTKTKAQYGAIAADGSGGLGVCWAEEVRSSIPDISTVPQLQCKSWNGSTWTRFGAASLNQSTSSWVGGVAVAYYNSMYHVAWTERVPSGVAKVYLCAWNGSTCGLIGGGALNMNASTGWAFHPALTTDGTTLWLGWEEQATLGSHSLGYVWSWNGSALAQVGGAIAADTTNGSVEGITLTSVSGRPTAAWGEITYGNLRQTYIRQWNGALWNPTLGAPQCVFSTSALPLAVTGQPYSTTIATTGCAGPTFAVTAGSLPTGISLNASTGALTGTPSVVAISSFTITATDVNGVPAQPLSLQVEHGPLAPVLGSMRR